MGNVKNACNPTLSKLKFWQTTYCADGTTLESDGLMVIQKKLREGVQCSQHHIIMQQGICSEISNKQL